MSEEHQNLFRDLVEKIRRLKIWQLASNCASLGCCISEKSLAQIESEHQELSRQIEEVING